MALPIALQEPTERDPQDRFLLVYNWVNVALEWICRCDAKASPLWDDTKSWEHPFHAVVDHQFPLSNLQPTCPCEKVEDFPWMMVFHIASPCFSGNLALKQILSFYPLISLPSGKHTKKHGKSPFSMGKSTMNDHFQ